jgi:hypothetical protein
MAVSRSLHDSVLFVALLSTALAMGAALAHALELPNKIGLSRDDYFTVQAIYRGWNLLAILLLIQFASIVGVIVLSTPNTYVFRAANAALIALVAAQAVFWAFTFPANAATQNWTHVPSDWETLRMQWEYSHAVGAAFQITALCALIFAALARAR